MPHPLAWRPPQDPAPWNIVWRAGELFPIDIGDGNTYEGKWDTFAQKYIGARDIERRIVRATRRAGAAAALAMLSRACPLRLDISPPRRIVS